MKDIKFKIFASALASVLLVGCNDLDTEPLGAVVTSDQKEEVVKNDPEMVSASVTTARRTAARNRSGRSWCDVQCIWQCHPHFFWTRRLRLWFNYAELGQPRHRYGWFRYKL